jgi:hypothetical protein
MNRELPSRIPIRHSLCERESYLWFCATMARQTRPAAHITTTKYRRNRVFEANPRQLAKSDPNHSEIHALAPVECAALAYHFKTGQAKPATNPDSLIEISKRRPVQ